MSSSLVPAPIRPSSHPTRRPARPITKCDRCRGRKSKCNSAQPCDACLKSNASCLYTHGRPTQACSMVTNTQQEGISPAGSISPTIARRCSTMSQTIDTISVREERSTLINKINTLQKLLHDVNTHQTLQAYQFNLSLQNHLTAGCYQAGVDLETDNLATHFSKLWLRKEPDQSFFQATHPALVKLRQEQVPRWQESRRWKTWLDYQNESKYQQLKRFEPNLLPEEKECHELFWRFIVSCDWYFEVLTETEANLAELEIYHYRTLGLVPTTSEQWTRIALSLAVCRLTLACLDWASTHESEELSKKRCNQILNWCDLAVMALDCADFDQNPTVQGMRVLIILTSTIFFETDYGLMGSSPQMVKLHDKAVEVSERLNLHRDPPAHLSSKEKDDRRRMWWALITIDSHFCSTGATSKGVLRLQDSDTKLPAPRNIHTSRSYDYADESLAPLDLRSARSRFELGKFNNRCCQLLAQRRPLATLADIWKLDQDLLALESRVPDDQRWSSTLDLSMIFQTPLRPSVSIDDTLRNGQQIFYIGFWHIRSKIHRGLLYTKEPTTQMNVDAHRDIVRRCSVCLLHLYRHTKLPTAFISAIASAALTLSLELIDQPFQPYNLEIRTIILEVFSRLQANSSPIIGRACQVLEYFLKPIQPYTGISKTYPKSLDQWDHSTSVVLPKSSQTLSTNGTLPCTNGGPVTSQENPIGDGSSGSLVGGVKNDWSSGSNEAYHESTNEQPMVGLTNPLTQVTTNDLLTLTTGDESKALQYVYHNQDNNSKTEWMVEKTPELKLDNENYFSNDIQSIRPSMTSIIQTPASNFPSNANNESSLLNYSQSLIQVGPVLTPTSMSNPTRVYSANDQEPTIYPTTIQPSNIFQSASTSSSKVPYYEQGIYYY